MIARHAFLQFECTVISVNMPIFCFRAAVGRSKRDNIACNAIEWVGVDVIGAGPARLISGKLQAVMLRDACGRSQSLVSSKETTAIREWDVLVMRVLFCVKRAKRRNMFEVTGTVSKSSV